MRATTSRVTRRGRLVRLSEDADARWQSFAAERGVSVTALIEAFAAHLEQRTVNMADVVTEARSIDSSRRQR
jgi:histone H3/H4